MTFVLATEVIDYASYSLQAIAVTRVAWCLLYVTCKTRLQENLMNTRKSINHNVASALLSGALLAMISLNAIADSSVTLDSCEPSAATLMPGLKVSASISNPSAKVRWSIAPGRPIPVTLMPTLTITADAYSLTTTTLPTVTVVAPSENLPAASSQTLVMAPTVAPRMHDIAN